MVEMDDGAFAGILVSFVVLYVLALIFLCVGCKTVKQSQVMIIERFGRYNRTLTPGLHWVWPYTEAPRQIDWKKLNNPAYSNARSLAVITYQTPFIDLREHVLDLQPHNVITKDTVYISVDALVYFRITDPRAAVYKIENLPDAIEMLTQSTLRNIIAGLTLDETFSSRDYVNSLLLQQVAADAARWGVTITRLGIEEILPPQDIRTAMECQMTEERNRRSTIISANGQREREIILSKGQASKIILTAEGRKSQEIASARGLARKRMIQASADAECLELLQESLHKEAQVRGLGENPSDQEMLTCDGPSLKAIEYNTALQQLDNLKNQSVGSLIMVPRDFYERSKNFFPGTTDTFGGDMLENTFATGGKNKRM